ncbi:MAG: hypothetical protein RIS76_1078, partial [Verrucomicrobiota bacterium]
PTAHRSVAGRLPLLFLAALLAGPLAAFPPAPPHVIYGVIRDKIGQPLMNASARVLLQANGGKQLSTQVFPGAEPGCNYRLEVPMDAGLVGGLYQPSAMLPLAPFQIKVVIGGVVYLPMEMTGNLLLGQAGQRTRLDLTLGVDANGDGLPDDWQRQFGTNIDLITPDAHAGHGLTYRQLYLTGIYAVNPTNGFNLEIVSQGNETHGLQFLGIAGHHYQIVGSSDMTTWLPVGFRVPAEGAAAPERKSYSAATTGVVQVETPAPEAALPGMFYRLVLSP